MLTSKALSYATSVLLVLTYTLYLTYYFINGVGFKINDAYTAIAELQWAGDALSNFGSSVLLSIGVVSITLIAIIYFVKRDRNEIPAKVLISIHE